MTNTRTIWARHDADAKWHAIQDVQDGGSAITYCRGRWPATETAALDTEPAVEDRCGRCVVKTLAESLGVEKTKRASSGTSEFRAKD